MAKRRLSEQQRRRIREKQSRHKGRANNTNPADKLLSSSELGPEQSGTIVAHFGAQADVESASGIHRCYLRANLNSIVTGDQAIWREGQPNGVVVAIQDRHSELCRPDNQGNQRLVAANIDRIVVVIAPEPEPHANLIDRYLVAAENQGIKPTLVLNKIDRLTTENRGDIEDMLAIYDRIGYDVLHVSAKQRAGIELLSEYLAPLTCVFVGQSGVGKSSLLNALAPDADISVGALSENTLKGTHTTTTSRLFHLPNGGSVIDSPGIREFGLWHLDARRVAEGFIEFQPYLGSCKFRDCHHKQEPGCALNRAIDEGNIDPRRIDSFWHIVNSLTTP